MIKKVFGYFERIRNRFISVEEQARRAGVTMGKNNMVSSRFWEFAEPFLIEVGSNCQITGGVKFLTHGGAGAVRHLSPKFDVFGKIVIGDYVYIGCNSLICPGVQIGNHVLIAAGSVVTRSIPNDVVVGGNPAKIICSIEDYYSRNVKYDLGTKGLSINDKKAFLNRLSDDKFLRKPLMIDGK